MGARVNLKDPSLLREQCWVDGEWVEASGGRTIEVENPATGEVIGTVPAFTAEDTRAAIEAADRAWGPWRSRRSGRGWPSLAAGHAGRGTLR